MSYAYVRFFLVDFGLSIIMGLSCMRAMVSVGFLDQG